MKIAVCLSGEPRFIKEGHSQIIEKIKSKYEIIDFFVHTWWDDNSLISSTANRKFIYDKNSLELIMNLYRPKLILNEPQLNFKIYDDVNYETLNPISPHSMFYSIKTSNDLKCFYENKNSFKYDFVMRCRFDISIELFDIDFSEIDLSHIYMSTVGNGYPNDQFAISNSENMDYYSSLYDKIDDYHRQGFKGFVGERLLKYHLKDKMILTDKIKNNIIKNI